jgi:hypothetical protein
MCRTGSGTLGGKDGRVLGSVIPGRGPTIRHIRFSDGELSGSGYLVSEKVQKMLHFYTAFGKYKIFAARLPKYARILAL